MLTSQPASVGTTFFSRATAASDAAPLFRAGVAGRASGRGQDSRGSGAAFFFPRALGDGRDGRDGARAARARREAFVERGTDASSPPQPIAIGIFSVYYVGEKLLQASSSKPSSDH